MKVREILRQKGPEVFTIGEDKPVFDAMRVLVNNRVGALLVLNSDAKIVGILSERDIVRFAFEDIESIKERQVKEIMTKNLLIVEPNDDIEYVESIMTQNKVRHLPVVSDKILIGIISIGDIVKTKFKHISAENKYLRDYIEGGLA